MKHLTAAAATAISILFVGGCTFTGPNNYPIPFTKGSHADDVAITVVLANAANLVANSEVKYRDVPVGTVRRIELKNWSAVLTVGLTKDARIPANATATLAQKSLLGAEYLALDSPPAGASGELLRSGDVIGLDRTGRYPETEEVLSAAAMLLNGGGLGQVHAIIKELNDALDGRSGDVKALVKRITEFSAELDSQRTNLVSAMESLDRLARKVNNQSDKIDEALGSLPNGVNVINEQRDELVSGLDSLHELSGVVHRIVTQSQSDVTFDLEALRPVSRQLAASSDNLAKALGDLTFPFPTKVVNRAYQGDYLNLAITFNVSVPELARVFAGGTPLDGLYTAFIKGVPTGAAVDRSDPLGDPSKLVRGDPPPSAAPAIGQPTLAPAKPSGQPNQLPAPDSTPADGLGGLVGGLLGGLGGR
ncbi:MAG: MCE family protein [Aeromicrobium sp.]